MTNHNREGTFLGANGLELYYQCWHPQASAKAIVVLVHGFGVHSNIFSRLVEFLVQKDLGVYGFDLRGHGRSPGQRGYINSWTEHRLDLAAFLNLVQIKESHLPLFIIGQSMGGIVTLDYVLRTSAQQLKPIAGLILIAPALGLCITPWKLTLGKLLSLIYPRFALNTGIDYEAASRDPQVIEANRHDPLRHAQGTARLSTELLKTINWVKGQAQELATPLLLLHGLADRVTPADSSQSFFQHLTLADKELRLYPNSYHELHSDTNCLEVATDIHSWIGNHL
ncbi:MAG: lysophospholipase [Cyanobacteria bacterium J06621_8]